MKKHKLLFLGVALAAMPFVASAQADTPFDPTQYNGKTYTRADRYLKDFTLHNVSEDSPFGDVTYNVGQPNTQTTKNVFYNLTSATPFVTTPGATVNFSGMTIGSNWMHGYLYIDVDRDGGFNSYLNDVNYPTDKAGLPAKFAELLKAPQGKHGDLMSFNRHNFATTNNGNDWYNSFGDRPIHNAESNDPQNSGGGWPTDKTMPSFVIPEYLEAGEYFALFKIDYNNLDQHADHTAENANFIQNNGGVAVYFKIKVEVLTTNTVTIASNNPDYGTVKFDGDDTNATEDTFTGGQSVTVIATANPGYQFEKWVNGSNIVSTSETYTFTCTEDVDLVAYFKEANGTTDRYPAMTQNWTEGNNPQGRNRFLKKIVVSADGTEGSNPLVEQVIDITDEAELGDFNVAVIDKTAYPIVVEKGTSTFNITFFGWTGALNIDGGNREAQLDWTQEAHYIDWNNDGDFTDEGECIGKGYNHYGSLSWSATNGSHILTDGETAQVKVPDGQAAGDYRMRIVFFEDASPTTVQWQEKLFGEYNNVIRNGVAYDFTIHIVEASYNNWVPSVDVTAGTFTSTTTYNINGLPSHHSLKAKMTVVKQNESGIAAIANYDEEAIVDEQPLDESNSVTLTATGLDPDSQYFCTVKLHHADSDIELLNSEPMFYLVDTNDEGNVSGVKDLTVTETETAPRYYNLQGIEVAQPTSAGIYIVRQGNKVSKVYVK